MLPKGKGYDTYEGSAITVCISLCAPIAAYGQITFWKMHDSIGWSGLFSADKVCDITEASLKNIEKEVRSLLLHHGLSLLDKEFASKQLPDDVIQVFGS